LLGGGSDGPLGCDVALLQFVLQLLQLGLQLWVRVGHGVEYRRACGDQVERMCAMVARDMSGQYVGRRDGAELREAS
jgi:hypothetical protein